MRVYYGQNLLLVLQYTLVSAFKVVMGTVCALNVDACEY